jgi:hypothetical protein
VLTRSEARLSTVTRFIVHRWHALASLPDRGTLTALARPCLFVPLGAMQPIEKATSAKAANDRRGVMDFPKCFPGGRRDHRRAWA